MSFLSSFHQRCWAAKLNVRCSFYQEVGNFKKSATAGQSKCSLLCLVSLRIDVCTYYEQQPVTSITTERKTNFLYAQYSACSAKSFSLELQLTIEFSHVFWTKLLPWQGFLSQNWTNTDKIVQNSSTFWFNLAEIWLLITYNLYSCNSVVFVFIKFIYKFLRQLNCRQWTDIQYSWRTEYLPIMQLSIYVT